jgi:nitrogen fixation protein FixH
MRLSLRDKHGHALDGAKVSVEAIPVRLAERAGTVTLAPLGNGEYEAALPAIVLGQWELRVTVEREGQLWTDSYRRVLVAGAGG